MFLLSGCAIQYYDRASGTDHLWGFGHLKMKATPPQEGVRATIKGTEVLGVGLAVGREDYFLSTGWNNQRKLSVIDTNTCIRLEWPSSDLFRVRIGTNFPPSLQDPVEPKPSVEGKEDP